MSEDLLKIANGYGNVDVRGGVPGGYVHVPGERLQPLCRKLKIKFAPALIDFTGKRRYGYSPVLDGVVVSSRSAPKLLAELEARQQRSSKRKKPTPEQRAVARKRRQQRDIEQFAAEIRFRFPSMPSGEENEIAGHACKIGSGRVGRSSVAEDPVMAAVVAHVRHCHTNYDELLDAIYELAFDREDRDQMRLEARDQVRDQVRAIIHQWEQDKEPDIEE
jgi:hypothetical protein